MSNVLAQGEYIGGAVPFGYRLDDARRLVAEPAEQDAIREARSLRGQRLPLRSVAARLEAQG